MIERFLKLRLYVNAVLNKSVARRNKLNKYALTNDEVFLAESLLLVLEPFKVITKLLSNSKLTNSRILPCLVFLKKKLQSNSKDKEDLNALKSFMLNCLNFYVEKHKMFDNVFLITATYLDPEFKSFDFVVDLSDKQPDEFILIATNYLINKNKELNPNDCFIENETKEAPQVTNSVEEELYSFLKPKSSSNNKGQNKKKRSIENEIKTYNSMKIETSDFSTFWYHCNEKLPKFAKLVRFICCGPPTTVSSERDFSMGTDIITPKRNKLSDNKIEYLSFLKRNLDRKYK